MEFELVVGGGNSSEKAILVDNDPNLIQIFIRSPNGKTMTIIMNKNDKIMNIKQIIYNKTGLKPKYQYLLYNGKHLNNDSILNDYNISNETNIELSLKLKGGCSFEACCLWPESDCCICCFVCQFCGCLYNSFCAFWIAGCDKNCPVRRCDCGCGKCSWDDCCECC